MIETWQAGMLVSAARDHSELRGGGGGPRMAAADGPRLRRPPRPRTRRIVVERPRTRRNPRGLRGAGPVEHPGLGLPRLGPAARPSRARRRSRLGHHERHGRIDRDRPPLRCDGCPPGHVARQRNAPARRAIRPDLHLRPGRNGLRDGAGASMSAFSVVAENGVAVVTLDLPGEPVNKLNQAVKTEFEALLPRLRDESAVRAVVLISGKPDTFIAGADIEEFVALRSLAEAEALSREGQQMINRVAAFPKPVVAAIHGACLGGGLELALACHWRVATDHPKTQLGLPEIQLGILPGAGGCQRLPRLIGARAALDIILAGKSERGAKAFRLGMVDELVPPAILRQVAVAAAERLAEHGIPARPRKGGLGAWLLDGNPLGRRLVYRLA